MSNQIPVIQILDLLPAALQVSRNMKILFVNQAWLALYEAHRLEDVINNDIRDINDQDKATLEDRAHAINMTTPRRYQDTTIRTFTGKKVWVNTTDIKIIWTDEHPADLTIMEPQGERLPGELYHEMFQKIVENSPLSILIHRDNKALYANPLFDATIGASTTGRQADYNIPQLSQLSPEEARERYALVYASDHPVSRRYALKKKDGSCMWMQSSSRKIFWHDGKPAVQSIFQDITPLIEAEQKQEKLTRDIKRKNADMKRVTIDLRSILEQLEKEKLRIREDLAEQLQKDILPLVKKLGQTPGSARHLQTIEEKVRSISLGVNPDSSHLLSFQEQEVCRLIKDGLRTKEIARILRISPRTVDRHRCNIRRKLGLKKHKKNLQSFLLRPQTA